jgi:hypothetical protein
MMLLWQDRRNPTSGITIYLPHTKGSDGKETHEARLSTNIGGVPNLLADEGTYSLRFGLVTAPVALGARDKARHVALHDDGTKGLAVNTDNARFTINVPYPTSIRRQRLMRFPDHNNPPYRLTGQTQAAFDVRPGEMAGVHVLTYDGVAAPVELYPPAGSTVTIAAQTPTVLNLYLYAGCLDIRKDSDLPFFNSLLRHQGRPQSLDLVVQNMNPDSVAKEDEIVDNDLSRLSVYDLDELPGGPHAGHRVYDPVGCVNGWGS